MTKELELPASIMDVQDEDEFNNILIYGDSGVGKTVLAGSDSEVLFVAPEDNGTLSAKRFGTTAKKWKIRDGAKGWDDIASAYKWLASLEVIPFNWVVLDSLTEMQDMCMQKVLAEAVATSPGRDPDVPQIGDWQPYYNKFMRMVKLFNALEVNMLYTALQQDEENEDGEKVVLPMLQGKGTQYAKKVASTMTSFGHMRVARKQVKIESEDGGEPVKKIEEFRVIQWSATKTIMAKDRTRVLEPRTIVGEGYLSSLKDIRELLENGPDQPEAGRVVPAKKAPAKKVVRTETAPAEDKPEVVRAEPESDEVDSDDIGLVGAESGAE